MLNFTWWALFSSDCVQVSVEDTRPPERGPPVEESQAEQDRQQEFDSDEQWVGGGWEGGATDQFQKHVSF